MARAASATSGTVLNRDSSAEALATSSRMLPYIASRPAASTESSPFVAQRDAPKHEFTSVCRPQTKHLPRTRGYCPRRLRCQGEEAAAGCFSGASLEGWEQDGHRSVRRKPGSAVLEPAAAFSNRDGFPPHPPASQRYGGAVPGPAGGGPGGPGRGPPAGPAAAPQGGPPPQP